MSDFDSAQEFNQMLAQRFSKWLLVQRYVPATRHKYLLSVSNFAQFLGARKITATTHADIQDHLGQQAERGSSVHSLQTVLQGLRSFFDFLNLGGLLNWVPPRMVRVRRDRRRVPRYLTRNQVKRLLGAARTPREHAMLGLLYGSGCRSSELLTMRIENIDFNERRVKVRGKAGTRYVPFPARVAPVLRKYTKGRAVGYIFVEERAPSETPRCSRTQRRLGLRPSKVRRDGQELGNGLSLYSARGLQNKARGRDRVLSPGTR